MSAARMPLEAPIQVGRTEVATTSISADVVAAQRGDRAAFARLVDAFRGVVCALSLAVVREVDASEEEVAQEIFVSAWREMGSLRSPESFGPWLRQVTRN